ncbi:hypothetical protein BDP27DRAFT_1338719 [Rhodocollybia butyracea]|uniref:Uncharacterized protein n=1 Tax=Rhodocollybia butyracea TaxID=206335 RepID=A0A9P5TZQ5_9AGAR|nr:hypothetical protein BDP27DRAFT_1338719 [Rhodocollybia butyracea]
MSVHDFSMSSNANHCIHVPSWRGSITSAHLCQSASAPSHGHLQVQPQSTSSMAICHAESVNLMYSKWRVIRLPSEGLNIISELSHSLLW